MRGKFVVRNQKETEALAKKFANELRGGEIIALFSDHSGHRSHRVTTMPSRPSVSEE